MSVEKKECSCSAAPNLILACSGAADVGELSDKVARKLTRGGQAKMYCLAGVGAQIPGMVEVTRQAGRIVAIDGCPVDCARKCLENAGFTGFSHVRVTEMGLEKGKCPSTDANISIVEEKVLALIAGA